MHIKKCEICGKRFYGRYNSKYCSPKCKKLGQKEYYKKNRDYIIKRQKKWYANNRDERIEYQKEYDENNKDKKYEYNKEYKKRKIAELNEQFEGDLNLILEKCPNRWMEREAKMQVWFKESYIDGMIAKIESTPVCEVTGEKEDLVIHHLYSFNTHPELGNDVANMVRVTKHIHREFHKIYDFGNNTPEQWIEFVKNSKQ